MSHYAFLVLIIFISALTGASANDPATPLDPDVTHVETGGHWKQDSSFGHYRLVVRHICNPEHCASLAFLEWVERRPNKGNTIRQRVAVHEINRGVGWIISDVSSRIDKAKGFLFDVRLVNTHDETAASLRIRPMTFGVYEGSLLVE